MNEQKDKMAVKYMLKKEDFGYHFKKCIMIAKSCVILNKIHPIQEVELLKKYLIKNGKVKKTSRGYILRSNFSVGPLMAYNLCSEEVKSDLGDLEQDVIINEAKDADKDIKQYFEIPCVMSSDSSFGIGIRKYELKLKSVERFFIKKDFLQRAQSADFSEIEKFVVATLEITGIISNYRRGDANRREADVIAEDRQIEIVSCLNAANSTIRYKHKALEIALILDSVDTGYYLLPEGVEKKFESKSYAAEYKLELAIFFIGTRKTVSKMIEQLRLELEERTIKNSFEKIYFIMVDLINDEISCIFGNEIQVIDIKENPIIMYEKMDMDFYDISDTESYLVTFENIFTNQKEVGYLTGNEIKKIIKEYKIWM